MGFEDDERASSAQQLRDTRASTRRERGLALDRLAARQVDVVSRAQLRALGVHREEVRRRVAARQWVLRTPNVVGLTTGPPSRAQRRWIALLHSPSPSGLAGRTALEMHGLRGWEKDVVEVIVPVGAHHPSPGVAFHRSRRPYDAWLGRREGLRVLAVEPAVLLLASRLPQPRSCAGVLAACVQQRLTTADGLLAWMPRLPVLPRAKMITSLLGDIGGGAHSAAELDLGEVCRRAGLPPPDRQRSRVDSAGRHRWTDAEWDLPGGVVVVLEVDGAFHMDVEHWTADKRRHRRLSSTTRIVVGCTAFELRFTPEEVVADLRALGVPTLGAVAA